MIRREAENNQWILISQVEHARLAGLLAGAWNDEAFAGRRAEMVSAVDHHDDGWSAWEVAPKVDAQSGHPLDFLETPLTDSLAIWRDSIAAAASKAGPLAGYMVSGHFSALLRSSSRLKDQAVNAALADDFLRQQGEQQSAWLAASHIDRASADRAVGWLQLFDAISLWLCCAEGHEAETFDTPTGQSLAFRPQQADAHDLRVLPWPFEPPRLELIAVGRALPAAKYANPSDLATAAATPVTLSWRLSPA